MDGTDSIDGALDPRIQIELENLNDATDDINKLETELDEAHAAFRQLLSETTKRLQGILNKVGNSSVEKARCYYDALEVARQAHIKCQQQAQLFQRVSEIHAAAKETVALAESRFMSHQHEWNFDQAWQDMLNHATLKVMDAESQKAECDREHYRRTVLFHDAKKRLLQLEEKHRRAIIKARPYFEVKAHCDQMLATQKERVECLQKAIQDAKTNYASSLRRLEDISNQIHQQRRDYDIIANGPREPGVGAELVSPQKASNYDKEFIQLNENKTKDVISNLLHKPIKIEDYDSARNLQDDSEHLGKRSVDGSEATSSQWELELESTIESLNNLTRENSVIHRNSKHENISDLRFYKDESTMSKNFAPEFNYNFSQSEDYSVQNLNQSKKLTKDCQIQRNSYTSIPLVTHFEESAVIRNETTDSLPLNERKITLKNNTSRSVSNSPMKGNVFSLGTRITQKEICKSIAKYVPNSVFNFGFNNIKSKSNNDINSFSSADINSIEEYQSLNDIIGNKTDNIEFDKQDVKHNNEQSLTVKEAYDNGLKLNSAQQLSNAIRISLKSNTDLISKNKWFRSNSVQFLPFSASTSSNKVKEIVTSSNENILRRTSTDNCNQSSIAQKLVEDVSNVNELPVLSFWEKFDSLANSKSKSFSMTNLGDKQNLVSLDNLRTNETKKTASTGTLTNLIRDNSFSRTVR